MECEHDFEWAELEHESDDVPVRMNPKTDGIIRRTISVHRIIDSCRKCGLREEREWRECDCSPDDPEE